MLDATEATAFRPENTVGDQLLASFHESFASSTKTIEGAYQGLSVESASTIAKMIGLEGANAAGLSISAVNSYRNLLYGFDLNGAQTAGLLEISKRNTDFKFFWQNIKQQSGFSAEILSTWKENLLAQAEKTGITTVRADDLPEIFKANDQLIDKVRVSESGEILAKIQTKFVGKNGAEWFEKAMSSSWDKYLQGDVDVLECPKDYYDDVIKEAARRRAKLENQLARVTADGKFDVAERIQAKLDKISVIEKMVEPSTVTRSEAILARLSPKGYVLNLAKNEIASVANAEGLKGGKMAAGLTFAVATIDNLSSCIEGEITVEEMAANIAGDTVAAGALGYGTTFVSSAVASGMRATSNQLIRTVGGGCLPAAAVSFAVESFGDVADFAQGKIDGAELALDLGENATMVAGGIAGMKAGALVGAAVGGPAGAAVGGVVGGVIGCAVSSQAYATAVEVGSESAGYFAGKVEAAAGSTIDAIEQVAPDQIDNAKAAFNDFFSSNNLPFSV